MHGRKIGVAGIPLVLMLLVFVGLSRPNSAFAKKLEVQETGSRCSNKPNHNAEDWILKQVADGNAADLMKFPETQRLIRASFLQDLLTKRSSAVTVHRHGVHIGHAVVCEPIDLDLAEVSFDVSLMESYFDKDVSLSRSRFRRSLRLDKSIFAGAFDAAGANVAEYFLAPEAQFNKEARFDAIKVGQMFSLERAIFCGAVNFDSAEIGGSLTADNAQFIDIQPTSFFETTVGRDASFCRVLFNGGANFTIAHIGGSFFANDSKFTSTEEQVDFSGMKVNRTASFQRTTFEGPARFNWAEIGGIFDVIETRFNSDKKATSFWRMKVDEARFVEATFGHRIDLDELTYNKIFAGSPDDLLDFIGQSNFNAEVYSELEKYYLRQGSQSLADEVYIAQRRRERAEHLKEPRWPRHSLVPNWLLPRFLGSLLLDGLVGYGRRPWLALFWSVGFVMLGWIIFRDKKNMILQRKEDAQRTYNGFWYSFDLFLPVVQLEEASVWRPKDDYRFAWYVKLHRIVGWILIPLGLAAITGIVK